jgi:hypothetical protein
MKTRLPSPFNVLPRFAGLTLAWGLLALARMASAQSTATAAAACTAFDLSPPCVQARMDALSQAHPRLAQRTPEHLVLALDDGHYRLLADSEQRLDAVALEPTARFLILRERHSQGYRWHVVSLKTGSLTRTEGFAVFSPDGQHFLAFQNVSADGKFPGVARLFQARHPVPQLVWRAQCEDDLLWGATAVQWQDSSQVTFTQTRLEDPSLPQAQEKGLVQVQYTDKRWQAKGLRCALKPKS